MEGIERGSGERKKGGGLGKRGEGTPVKKPSFVHFPQIFYLPFPFLTFSPPPPPSLFAPATQAVINWEAGSYFFTCLQITQVKRLN